jgi:hypothetical protein
MWDAGIIPLALIVGTLSGAWPYFKVLTMTICWLAPPRLLSAK